MTTVAHGEDAVALLAARWLDLAGHRLAREVATGRMCDRCARSALVTIGLAGGLPPATLARDVVKGYEDKMRSIAVAVLALLDEADAA